MAEGLTLAVIFVLAHVVEGPDFPEPDSEGSIAHNWAEHQLVTTSNFCRHNDLVSFICGGLNFQIEHHLFPRVSHVHYKALSEIVKDTAEEFKIKYHEQETFGELLDHIFAC
ncbi:MAG: fatty acid desaturase [Bacteroidia bacterium]